MNNIVGWIGNTVRDPLDTLRAMAGRDVNHQNTATGSNWAISLVDRSGDGDFLAKDNVTVALTGRVTTNTKILSAESIHRAYQDVGENLFSQLNGHFQLAILDHKSQRLHLSVDRIGAYALRFHPTGNGGLIFASNVTLIRQHPAVTAVLDRQQIFNYLYFHMVPGPGTIFSNIHKVEAGHCVTWHDSEISQKRYWLPSFDREANYSPGKLDDALRSTLDTSVANAADSDQSLGMFLSGGLDSSTVVGFAAKHFPKAPALCIGFSEKGYDEMEFARNTAQHFGVNLLEYYVTPRDVADAVTDIAARYDEPFGNSSAIPTLFCARLAKQHGIKTLLAGDGGDELFAGNKRYATQLIFDTYSKVPSFLKPAMESIFLSALFQKTPLLRKAYRYIEQAKIPLPKRLERYNHLEMLGMDTVFSTDFLDVIDTEKPLAMLQERFWDKKIEGDVVDRMLYTDWKFTLTDNDLRKVTHMCQSEGIQVRYPMLDDQLLQFSCKIPSEDKIKKSDLRHFFKRSLSDFLPQKTLTKEKHGFGLPFGIWLKNAKELEYLGTDVLDAFGSRGVLSKPFLNKLRSAHENEHAAYYGEMIWVIILLELWLDSHGLDF